MLFRRLKFLKIMHIVQCTEKPLVEDFHKNNVGILPYGILINDHI
jgi:hypothetical protein